MKVDEIAFFYYCYGLRTCYGVSIRDVMNQCFDGVIHPKRCWYLLKKWARLGFYDYGVSLDLGWFNSIDTMPERYRNIAIRMYDV